MVRVNTGEMVSSTRVRVLLHDSIDRCKTRNYPNIDVMFKWLIAIFDAKMQRELASIRQKNVQPLLDTVLTEAETDDTRETS